MAAALPALAVGDLVEAGGEPRVLDLRLAERLGYPEPRKIRRLIERHRPALERFGEISAHRGPKTGRGRPIQGWLLNKRQALFITTKSETPNATEVTIEMVEVFDAWTSGHLAPPAPPALPEPEAWRTAVADWLMELARSELVTRTHVEVLLPRIEDRLSAIEARLSGLAPAAPAPVAPPAAIAPRRRRGRSPIDHDKPVRDALIALWGTCTIDQARRAVLAQFGAARTPSRSALARYWQHLDDPDARRARPLAPRPAAHPAAAAASSHRE